MSDIVIEFCMCSDSDFLLPHLLTLFQGHCKSSIDLEYVTWARVVQLACSLISQVGYIIALETLSAASSSESLVFVGFVSRR